MGFVDYEEDGYVGIMTINRPQALNALNKDVLKDIEAAFDAVDLSRIRTIILTGAGEKSFVAGADIAAMSTMTKAEGEAFGKFGNDIFRKIETFPIPVIAAVNGFALGGGNELAMSCDILFRQCHVRPAGSWPGNHTGIRRHPETGPSDWRWKSKRDGLRREKHQGG